MEIKYLTDSSNQHAYNRTLKINSLFVILLLLVIVYPSIAKEELETNSVTLDLKQVSNADILLPVPQKVYYCQGSYFHAYHSRENCPGLQNCGAQIRYTDENTAVNSLGRKPCCRCWSNVDAKCRDDNPNYEESSGSTDYSPNYERSSGRVEDNSAAYVYLAMGIMMTGGILISNDVYIYPTYSTFKITDTIEYQGQQTGAGIGLTFGLRKTFAHSALEYGASYLKFETKYSYRNLYSKVTEHERWGVHFNFVHQFLYDTTPDWMKIYLGPSVNYVSDFGYGGIIGTEIKLFERLKLDVRYELTTQTNQIQAGIIFTYQTKYLWE